MFVILYQFLLFEFSILLTTAFVKAPGTVTLKIGIPDLIDNCYSEECQYNLEFCIGSGRSISEQCIWVPTKRYSGRYMENTIFLVEESFDMDNIRSSFYFNANFTFRNANMASKTIFKDNLIQYSVTNGIYRSSLHSENFVSMPIEIDVKCKAGFYPQYQCTKSCFQVPGINDCDINGTIVCSEGYSLLSSSGECIKDVCKLNPDVCQNNSTCENELSSIKCVCKPGYVGTTCEYWDPCKDHKCLNSAICVKRQSTLSYICQCVENYYGQFCENIDDPCKQLNCPPGSFCKRNIQKAVCLESPKREPSIELDKWFPKRKLRQDTTVSLITTNKVMSIMVDDSEIKKKEKVKLIQYPVHKDFTAVAIIIALLILLICCFGISFWMQRKKYLYKRKKQSVYPDFVQMPSVIAMRPHRELLDNYTKCRSMDDVFSNLSHHPSCCQFSTLSCKSGFNSLGRQQDSNDTYRFSNRNWPPKMRAKMPIMIEGSNLESIVAFGHLNESTQTNLEKIVDCPPIIDNNDERSSDVGNICPD